MANPHRGEVDIEIGGQSYRLAFTTNSICELEEHLGRGWFDIAGELSSWSPPIDADGKTVRKETPAEEQARVRRVRFSLMRAIFWAMLREHNPKITIKEAGTLMEAAGDKGGALSLINMVFERSMPEAKESSGNPPTPGAAANANGTGQRSANPGAS